MGSARHGRYTVLKKEKIDCAQKVFSIMQSKGILGDTVIHASLAHEYLRIGDILLIQIC